MGLQDIFALACGALVGVLTIVEVTPIKINPWSWLFKLIGKAMNAEVMEALNQTQKKLDAHIQADDERNADQIRTRILRFNNELLRDVPHTKEDFIDVLLDIDAYEIYCRSHEDYKNNRAAHAIANIGRTYDERLQKHDFLK